MSSRSAPSAVLGACFVLATVILWIAASFLAQFLVRPDQWGKQPQLPALLLVYICTSLFVVYIPIVHIKRRLQKSRYARGSEQQQERDDNALLAPRQVLPVAVVWFTAQYTFTQSLALTSVTSNTILSSSSSMFTLLASAVVLGEKVTPVKLISVAAVMTGTAMVTLADSTGDDSSHSLLGDALVLLSAFCYSCYTVMMRRQLQHDDADTPALFFGGIGAGTLLLGTPVLLGCCWMGVLNVWALQPRALGLAGMNGVMDYVLADYTWARAALLLGPTAATLGMNVQIPIATLGDFVLGHPHWLDSTSAIVLTAVGTVAILGGVICINLAAGRGHVAERSENQNPNDAATDTQPLLAAQAEV